MFFPLLASLAGIFVIIMIAMWITWGVYNNEGTSAPVDTDTLNVYFNTAIAFTVLAGVGMLGSLMSLGGMRHHMHHKSRY